MDDNKIVEFILHKKAILFTGIFTFIGAVVLTSSFLYINFTNKITHDFFQDVQITREGFSTVKTNPTKKK